MKSELSALSVTILIYKIVSHFDVLLYYYFCNSLYFDSQKAAQIDSNKSVLDDFVKQTKNVIVMLNFTAHIDYVFFDFHM